MILLTSVGLSNSSLKKLIENKTSWKSACIITSANPEGKDNKHNKYAKTQLLDIGIDRVDYIDFFENKNTKLEEYDLIYFAGGNTFRLLKSMLELENGIEGLKKELLNKDIMGVSAGSIILTPTVRIANEVEPHPYIDIPTFSALNLISFEIYPHYHTGAEEKLRKYEKENNTNVIRISNQGFLLIER